MKTDVLITAASWEDRYILGLEKNIQMFNPSCVIMFQYLSNLEWKKNNVEKTKKLLGDKLIEIKIDVLQPSENWFVIKTIFENYCREKNVLVDITTMTRETIWNSLFNCRLNKCNTEYIYFRPAGYSTNWISRDPLKPRLLYKMSGIAKLGVPSLLLITGGFDIQRLDSLIYHFEPKHIILFYQDSEDPRNKENYIDSQAFLRNKYHIPLPYVYDPYNVDSSYNLILEKLLEKDNGNADSYLKSYNIILNSLGVKTSAIALFNIWLKYPEVALSYIPSNEYNKKYSFGIGQWYTGSIPF